MIFMILIRKKQVLNNMLGKTLPSFDKCVSAFWSLFVPGWYPNLARWASQSWLHEFSHSTVFLISLDMFCCPYKWSHRTIHSTKHGATTANFASLHVQNGRHYIVYSLVIPIITGSLVTNDKKHSPRSIYCLALANFGIIFDCDHALIFLQ